MSMDSVTVPPWHGKGISKKSRRERRAREEMFKKQNGKCFWCGDQMEMTHFRVTLNGRTKANAAFASFEHLIPKSHGGLSGFANIVLAHVACNAARPRRKWAHDPVYGANAKPTPIKPPKRPVQRTSWHTRLMAPARPMVLRGGFLVEK